MKKVLFLQNKGKSLGGVWFVNKTIANELIKNDYDVSIVSIRNNKTDIKFEYNEKINVFTINEKDNWEITHFSDILSQFKNKSILNNIKEILKFLVDKMKIYKDFLKVRIYILKSKPDYIVVSHYQILCAIPNKYLKRTVFEQHSSFENTYSCRGTMKVLNNYRKKIFKFIWLTKETAKKAKSFKFNNSIYIYNPVRISKENLADTTSNKTLITISRLESEQKRIDLMINIAKKIFKDKKFSDWKLKLYGPIDKNSSLYIDVKGNSQIIFEGKVILPENELIKASIYLSTSSFEGFPMSLLEANECGLPSVSYYFGESTSECIINNQTGYIVDFSNENEFIEKLRGLMQNEEKLKEMSKSAKKFAKKFKPNIIVKKWIKLFNEIDEGCGLYGKN